MKPNARTPREASTSTPIGARRWRGYALACVLALGALALRMLLQQWVGAGVPYLIFFPAILIAAWYGGFGPGMLATGLSTVAAMYFILPPPGLAVEGVGEWMALAYFVSTGAAVSFLNRQLGRAYEAHQSAESLASARDQLLHAVFDTAVDGIVVIDAQGRIQAVNQAAGRLFGYTEDELVGRNVSMLMPSPYREEHDGYIARYLATGQAKVIGVGREVPGRRKDGTVFPLHLSLGEFSLGDERRFAATLHDLSARVRMEEELRERAALARLGEMAAVVAHEVKNPLAGIRGAIQTIVSRWQLDSRDAAILHEIIARIDSLNQMMKDVLMFARPPRPRPAPTEIVPLVSMTVRLLKADPAFRDVDVHVDGSCPAIPADAEMLKIVFQNLLVNGAHAMEGRGRIRVAVEATDTSCRIAFSDSGPGIPPEVRARLFTPFFTTKARGTGLGLATAKRLVQAQQGDISIECPPGGGTTVIVQLPAGSS